MLILDKQYNEGDKVWFIDEGVEGRYAEWGKIVAFKKNGDMVINFYAGMFVCSKKQIFRTKEECEKFIYLSEISKKFNKEKQND